MDLNAIWFALIAVLFCGYAVLDGFDLGVGILHLFRRDELERRLFVGAIGPVWDGNEVWLLTAGGALFAAFPVVYATVFSAFYTALMLLLLALIFRAVSLEFRKLVDSPTWRTCCDWGFGLGSTVAALLLGVALGNIMRGIPLNEQATFTGSFVGLLNPYSLLLGAVTLAGFVMHGALYLALKSDGPLRAELNRHALYAWVPLVFLLLLGVAGSIKAAPHLFVNPWALAPLCAGGLALICLPVLIARKRHGLAFSVSCALIVAVIATIATAMFPRLTPSSTDLAYSLTAYNASSSPHTLGVMLIIALIGVPLVLAYTAYTYWAFRGKADSAHADHGH